MLQINGAAPAGCFFLISSDAQQIRCAEKQPLLHTSTKFKSESYHNEMTTDVTHLLKAEGQL